MKDKVARSRSRSSSYSNSIANSLSSTQILSSSMNDIHKSDAIEGDGDNGSDPTSIDNHDSNESVDIEKSNNDKLTVYDLSDEDLDDDVNLQSSQHFSLPTSSTSTVTRAKTSPSSTVRSIISN